MSTAADTVMVITERERAIRWARGAEIRVRHGGWTAAALAEFQAWLRRRIGLTQKEGTRNELR